MITTPCLPRLRSKAARLRGAAALWFAAILGGCPVDHRTLQSETDGGEVGGAGAVDSGLAGSSSRAGNPPAHAGHAAVAGAHAASGEAGTGGEPAEVEVRPLVDGCVDLDMNGAADCSQSKIPNSNFVANVAGWMPEIGVSISFSDIDSFGASKSGSAFVEATGVAENDGNATYAAVGCLPVTAGSEVAILGDVFVPASENEGYAGLQLWFFDGPDCGGAFLSSLTSEYSNARDKWLTLKSSAGSTAPAGAQSMKARLAAIKPFRSSYFAVYFDNLLVDTP